MPVHFTRNIQFTRLIKTEGRLREFNFRKSGTTREEERYTVDTVDDRGNRIIFSMLRENETWKLSSTLLPNWITRYESSLNEAIDAEMSGRQ